MKSKVKWFNNQKGYGFITNRNSEDIFVHYSAILTNGFRTLREGEDVDFELLETSKGFQAVNVKSLEEVKM